MAGEGGTTSEKKHGLPSLRKSPLDFLSRHEARQAINPVAALDTSEAALALRTEPNSEKMLLAQHMSHASHGSHGSRESWRAWQSRITWLVVTICVPRGTAAEASIWR
jgi:hypothetical protein